MENVNLCKTLCDPYIKLLFQVHTHGRIMIGGVAKSTTTGGYTLGGGHSSLSPSLGLAVDNLLEVQVRI